jgi:hypothetical protein
MPSVLVAPRHRWIKPGGDLILDRTHPLAYGLISAFLLHEGSGVTVRDLAKPSRTSTLAAGASWTKTPYGLAVVPSSTAAQKNTFSDNPTTKGAPFTVEVMLKHTGSDATFAAIITDLTTWGCYVHGNKLDLDGGADPDSTGSLTTGNFYHCVWYWDGSNAGYAINGLRDAGGGSNTGITNPAVFTGWGGDGTNPAQNNTILWFRVWERVLADVETTALYVDPFGMFRSPSQDALSLAVAASRPSVIWTPPIHLFSPPSGGSGAITAQPGVGIGIGPNALVSSTYQVAATAGVGIGVAQNATVQTTYSIQAQPGVGIGVSQNALVKTNYQIAPVAGVGIGVAPNALVSTSYQIAPAAGLGIGIAQNALVSSTYTIAALAGVGIGVMWNATLSGNQNQIQAQAGVGVGIAQNILVQQTYQIAAQAAQGYGFAQNALVQQQYRIAALAGLAIGIAQNATLQSGLGANNPPPVATISPNAPVVQTGSVASNIPAASVSASAPIASKE